MPNPHFIAVATRKIVTGGAVGGSLPDNHLSLELFETSNSPAEGTRFSFRNPPANSTWKGSLELIGHLDKYGRYEWRSRGGRSVGPKTLQWVYQPISFIHKDAGENRRSPQLCVVLYAETDTAAKWDHLCQLASDYAWAEQNPPNNPSNGSWPALERWPNSFYCLPSTYPFNNSATFVRYLARAIDRHADVLVGVRHPGRIKDPANILFRSVAPTPTSGRHLARVPARRSRDTVV